MFTADTAEERDLRFYCLASDGAAWAKGRQTVWKEFANRMNVLASHPDPARRLQLLRDLRREHHLLYVAAKIVAARGPMSAEKMRAESAQIVDLRSGNSKLQRSPDENSYLNAARQNWFKITRRAGITALDPRGGPRERSLRGSFKRLEKVHSRRVKDWEGATIMATFLALHCARLSDEVQRAADANPNYVPPELHEALQLLQHARRLAESYVDSLSVA